MVGNKGGGCSSNNMRAIMSKLLFKYREKWRKIAREVLEKKSRRACFQNLVAFIECQVKIISDPSEDSKETAQAKPSCQYRFSSSEETR